MEVSRLIRIEGDNEYNRLMLAEHDEYYNGLGVNFHDTYFALDNASEWREPTTPRKVFFDIFANIDTKRDWVFLDCGSGLGHAMYLASFLFDKVFGVEIIPEIADLSRKNLAALMPSGVEYRVFNGDILELDEALISSANVFYISSPFLDTRMFENLVEKINVSLLEYEREIWLVYFYPHCEVALIKYAEVFPLVKTFQTIGKVNLYHHRPDRESITR